MRLIDADALMEYCNNLKDKTIDANDIARFPTAVGWISVKDRLPDVGETVLFTGINSYGNRFRTQKGYFNGGVWISDSIVLVKDAITHWMPIPEPPKEEQE